MDFAPLIPDMSQKNGCTNLLTKADTIITNSSMLVGTYSNKLLASIEVLLATTNSYYSNKIEAQSTHPIDIEKAMRGNFNSESKQADLQQLSLRYIKTQNMINAALNFNQYELLHNEMIKGAHRRFYEGDEMRNFRTFEYQGESYSFKEGTYRTQDVAVGDHIAPAFNRIDGMMHEFREGYGRELKYANLGRALVAIMASHHRLVWIHPFLDGNGRIARIMLDALLKNTTIPGVGLWSMSRGLARQSSEYKKMLSIADLDKQSTLDGRGPLSDKTLSAFCEFMLDIAIDQINFMQGALRLNHLSSRMDEYIIDARRGRFLDDGIETLPTYTEIILKELLLKGELQRGEIPTLIGKSESTAKRLTSTLQKHHIIQSVNHKSPFTFNFSAHFAARIFPDLIPQ
jgi:Fic family protein